MLLLSPLPRAACLPCLQGPQRAFHSLLDLLHVPSQHLPKPDPPLECQLHEKGQCLSVHSCSPCRCPATLNTRIRTTAHLKLWRSSVGAVGGKNSPEPPACPLPAAPTLRDSPAETSHSLEKLKALSIPAGHMPPALGVMDLRRPPSAPKPSDVSRSGRGGGGGGLWARPLSRAPAEFNSKVQSAFAPSQIKGRSAGEKNWLIEDRRGALDRRVHHRPLPTPSAVNALSPLPPFRPAAPQEKPINLTLIGFSICHNPWRSWGGGGGVGWGPIHIKSVLKKIFAGRLGWPLDSSLPPQGLQASHSPSWPQFPQWKAN